MNYEGCVNRATALLEAITTTATVQIKGFFFFTYCIILHAFTMILNINQAEFILC